MEAYENLRFEYITEADVALLAPIMKAAFDEDTRLHLGAESGGPEGYDDGSFLRKFALDKGSVAYKISADGKVIGAVILWMNSERGEGFLGNIFIDPEFENKGVGTKVWRFVEKKYTDIKLWRTETPGFSRRNHNFYVNKCGFHIIKIENPTELLESSFILEKSLK